MDIKKWLERGNKIDERIRCKKQQIEMWKSLSCGLVVSYMHGGSNSSYGSRVETYACKCTDMEDRIGQDLRELIDIKTEITNTLRQISNNIYGLILENRYILGKRWEEIAELLNYDTAYIQRLHGKALISAAELIK